MRRINQFGIRRIGDITDVVTDSCRNRRDHGRAITRSDPRPANNVKGLRTYDRIDLAAPDKLLHLGDCLNGPRISGP